MANTLLIKVENLQTLLLSFDQLQVHRAPTADGAYVEVTGALTRINLNDQDNLYTFVDSAGVATDFYKTIQFNSTTLATGDISLAFQAATLQQLLENMEVEILVTKAVKNTSGINLTADEKQFFTTTYNPLYCGVDKVLLNIGTFLVNIEEDTINRAVFECSREADAITFNKSVEGLASPIYLHARREYTCCHASLMLLNNRIGGAGGGVSSKRLGDFSVEYNTLGVQNMLDHLRACMAKWEPQVMAAGRKTQKAIGVVKGDLNIDMPFVGRGYESHAFGGLPMVNTKIRRKGSRRFRKASLPAGLRSSRKIHHD